MNLIELIKEWFKTKYKQRKCNHQFTVPRPKTEILVDGNRQLTYFYVCRNCGRKKRL